MDDQLPLFDWPTVVMGEGYRRLVAFMFDEAEQHFRDVLHAGQGEEEEITKALHACKYWQALLHQNKEVPGTYPINELYEQFRRYEFGNIPGLHQLKDALLEYIAGLMLSDDRFYINDRDGETVSDLLMELRHYKKAEKVVLRRIEKQPNETGEQSAEDPLEYIQLVSGELTKELEALDLDEPDWEHYTPRHSGYIEDWEARMHLADQEKEEFIQSHKKEHLFYTGMLQQEQRYDEILQFIKHHRDSWHLNKMLAAILEPYPEESFRILEQKILSTLETERGRRVYRHIVEWLRLAKCIKPLEERTNCLINTLYHWKPALPVLKDEMRQAGIKPV